MSADVMNIERVGITPRQELYYHGDVLNVAVTFGAPFVGQCEAGLAEVGPSPPSGFRLQIFARSSDTLYEGQVRVNEDVVGPCLLWLRLTPVKGDAEVVAGTAGPLEVRPVRP
jgi:hypothetical protein